MLEFSLNRSCLEMLWAKRQAIQGTVQDWIALAFCRGDKNDLSDIRGGFPKFEIRAGKRAILWTNPDASSKGRNAGKNLTPQGSKKHAIFERDKSQKYEVAQGHHTGDPGWKQLMEEVGKQSFQISTASGIMTIQERRRESSANFFPRR